MDAVSTQRLDSDERRLLEILLIGFWGIGFASDSATVIFKDRPPVAMAFVGISIVWWFWQMILMFKRNSLVPNAAATIGVKMAAGVAWYLFRDYRFTPVLVGLILAIFFHFDRSRFRAARELRILCAVAGFLALTISGSNELRVRWVVLFVGFAVLTEAKRIADTGDETGRPNMKAPPTPPKMDDVSPSSINLLSSIFGKIEHFRVDSPEMAARVRKNKELVVSQVTALGFQPLCGYGETFSIFRLLLIFPAIVAIGMVLDRWPLSIYRRTRIMSHYLLYASPKLHTYVDIAEGGAKFLTRFLDGGMLVTSMGPGVKLDGPKLYKRSSLATVQEAWTVHQQRLELLQSQGKSIDTEIRWETFAEMVDNPLV